MILEHDGKRYQMLNRIAKEGEAVLIIGLSTEIRIIESLSNITVTDTKGDVHFHSQYATLKEIEDVDKWRDFKHFLLRGYVSDNCYYIVGNENGTYDVYKTIDNEAYNSAAQIKVIYPEMRNIPDEKLFMQSPDGVNMFLIWESLSEINMNRKRSGFDNETILNQGETE